MSRLSREQIAQRVARDIPEGAYVNLGIGLPTMEDNYLPAEKENIQGDLANWSTGAPGAIPAVGGAMDLAIGAKQVFVMMDLLTKQGESKLVAECSYPLTGLRCVSRLYTDHGVIARGPEGARVIELVDGVSLDDLRRLTGLALDMA